MAPTDEELGRRTSVYPPDGRRSSQYPESVNCPVIETSEKLVEFRLLLGITTHGSFKAPRGFDKNQRPRITTKGRPAPNRGVYVEVVDSEIKCRKNYKRTAVLINSCLGIQIVVAAALTALGASNSSHRTVTVFGAINTVIAGFLTYLKGSGLPNRLKYYENEWSKVREYIEQRERDFSIDNHLNVMDEVNRIRVMFNDVRSDIEMSTPDRFVGLRDSRSNTTVSHLPTLPGGQIRRLSSTMSEPLKEKVGMGGLQSQTVGVEKEADAYPAREGETFQSHIASDVGHLKKAVQDKTKELAHLESQIVQHARSALTRKAHETEDKTREIGELEKVVETTGRRTDLNTEQHVEAQAAAPIGDVASRMKATLDVNDPFKEEQHRPT